MSHPVAVIDIGSNSIKLLVAARNPDGTLATVHHQTVDARISAGISATAPQLSDEGIARGIEAIRTLLAEAGRFAPARTLLVATSAVRDAQNVDTFRERVRAATEQDVRVLTGVEEAAYIGRGLTCDPALADLNDFYVFDLGGGSLECLAFRNRQLEQAASLQLGCVRLMEKFISDPNKALGRTARYRIMQHVHDELVRGGFKFRRGRDRRHDHDRACDLWRQE